MNGYSYLTLEQRREIERMYAEGERVVGIAARLKRSAAAIYEELKRGYTGEFDSYARPKPICIEKCSPAIGWQQVIHYPNMREHIGKHLLMPQNLPSRIGRLVDQSSPVL